MCSWLDIGTRRVLEDMERFESGNSIQEAPHSVTQDLYQFGVNSSGSILLAFFGCSYFLFSRFDVMCFAGFVCYLDIGCVLLLIEQRSRVKF